MSEVDVSKPHLRSLFDGTMYELEGEMIVGRHTDCNIVLVQELGASRKHARFAVVDHNVYVTDLGSLNGTLVNGKKITNEALLSNGDTLIFDAYEYEMLIPSQSAKLAVDPNMTVFINRDEINKQHLSKPAIGVIDDWHVKGEAAAEKTDTAIAAAEKVTAEKVAIEKVTAEKIAAEKAAAEKAAIEKVAAEKAADDKAAAAAEKAADDKAAAAAAQHITPEVTPESQVETATPASIARPGAWSSSAAVNNPEVTMFASGVGARDATAIQVDRASISEPTLIVQTGENAGTLMQLIGEQTEWSIGSGADRDLRVAESGVSGNHAAIVREGSKWKAVDQMSINGTFVNGDRVNIRFINNGDELRFGPVECLFVVPDNFVGEEKFRKNNRKGFSLWKILVPIATLLILGGGYFLYSSGMLPLAAPPTTTITQ